MSRLASVSGIAVPDKASGEKKKVVYGSRPRGKKDKSATDGTNGGVVSGHTL